jgi:hypothetical protein
MFGSKVGRFFGSKVRRFWHKIQDVKEFHTQKQTLHRNVHKLRKTALLLS